MMFNILINAYACGPNMGSEPGMAWNWILNLSNYCKIHVITEGEWQNEIDDYIENNNLGDQVKFYYNPVSDYVRELCWNQGDWRFYFYYHKWQKKTLKIAKEIIAEEKIDLIHQLNMVGYREPGFLWSIQGIPKVWGPIGGFGTIPNSYLSLYSRKSSLKQRIKQFINKRQVYLPYIKNPIQYFDALVACNTEAKKVLEKMISKEIPVISEVGSKENFTINGLQDFYSPKLRIAWIGKNDDRKALPIALKVFELIENKNIELNIYGISYKESNCIERNENVIFHGWKQHHEVQQELGACHALLFTSLFEATGTVVLEALSMGLPVLCHNTCGQGDIIDNKCGYKVDMNGIDFSVQSFKNILLKLNDDRNLLMQLSNGARKRTNELTWKNNSKKMIDIYNSIIKN